MDLADLAELAARQLPRPDGRASQYVRPLKNLGILRHHQPTSFEAAIYEPVIILVLQGRKETVLGADSFPMGVGECLLASHDLPVIARVTKAPYLALLFAVELDTLRDLYEAMADAPPSAAQSCSLSVHTCDAKLVDALHRYLALAAAPTDAAALGPLVSREIHYRLATAPFGGMLRDLLRHDSHASAIARAIAQLRRDFRSPVEIPKLARSVGMSASSFHKHFKTITASSPLQYRKGLQLLEARRLLRAGTLSVSEAAFDVGYESAAQFSRDYRRKFGASPKHDLPAV
ncbi:AraC family transcriptional regulator [Pyxidicoccus xibeiensis]|uniref:AraC family transcriptional regulator n=1 Tax=Pyxidicoccus xibeiensis TaxID=2906759 RepID=UPI0020A7BE78|nr:AraC family transcriptional regulator [Pyxidicoccus xibeiensis]MCP3140530.1 AraC family transcriptional regulator [Pyxidicoccus xibeiensis]